MEGYQDGVPKTSMINSTRLIMNPYLFDQAWSHMCSKFYIYDVVGPVILGIKRPFWLNKR
uniref:Serine carboxypeptidase-like 50 n=1 Tax=Rhizophora mucronata TaxID=61149 RepID=A0A2P2P6G7_RHIMU